MISSAMVSTRCLGTGRRVELRRPARSGARALRDLVPGSGGVSRGLRMSSFSTT